MVKTGFCVTGKEILVGDCTTFFACCQELHRMELAVMTVVVHSKDVVTAEGVEITAEGLTQVRDLRPNIPICPIWACPLCASPGPRA